MSTSTRVDEVLRVGVVKGERLVAERWVPRSSDVTIGSDPRATLKVLHDLPVDPWPLITAKPSGGHTLTAPPGARTTIARGAAVSRGKGEASVTIDAHDRGKVRIGEYTILFHTVPAPGTTAAPRGDFRARLLDQDDALVFGFATVFGTAASVLVIAARLLLPVEEPDFVMNTNDAVWQQLKHAVAIAAPSAPVPTAPTTTPSPEVAPAIEAAPHIARVEPTEDGGAGPRPPRPRETLVSSEIFAIAHRGDPGRFDQPSPIATMKEFNGSPRVIADTIGAPRGPNDPDGIAEIGELDRIGRIGRVDLAPIDVPVTLDEDIICILPDPDMEPIQAVIKAHVGELKYCFESRAKMRSDLGGRVEVQWNIANGRVTATEVIDNQTGDDLLADCIERKIQMWSFRGVEDSEVSWPFVFKAR